MALYNNYETWSRKGKTQGTNNRKTFSLEKMEEKIDEVLSKYIPDFPKQVQINLPKLNKINKGVKQELPKVKLPKLQKI